MVRNLYPFQTQEVGQECQKIERSHLLKDDDKQNKIKSHQKVLKENKILQNLQTPQLHNQPTETQAQSFQIPGCVRALPQSLLLQTLFKRKMVKDKTFKFLMFKNRFQNLNILFFERIKTIKIHLTKEIPRKRRLITIVKNFQHFKIEMTISRNNVFKNPRFSTIPLKNHFLKELFERKVIP